MKNLLFSLIIVIFFSFTDTICSQNIYNINNNIESEFEKDLKMVERIYTLYSPSEKVKQNIRYIPDMEYNFFPIQYIDLEGIKKVTIQNEKGENEVDLYFNSDQTLNQVDESGSSVFYLYKDGVPSISIDLTGDTLKRYFYEKDTVYAISSRLDIKKYVLYGNMFILKEEFDVPTEYNFTNKTLDKKIKDITINKQELVINEQHTDLNTEEIYSDIQYSLPFCKTTIMYFPNNSILSTYSKWEKDENGNLYNHFTFKANNEEKDIREAFESKYLFRIENNMIISLEANTFDHGNFTLYYFYNK